MDSPLSAAVLRALDLAVFRREGPDQFRLDGEPPAWLGAIWPEVASSRVLGQLAEVAPFLENFLPDAELHWNAGGSGRARSGPWIESAPDGGTYPLEASALCLNGTPLLLVERLGEDYEQRRATLQTAREHLLAYERLSMEVQRKEILLHCVVHDMAAPLQNMMMALATLDEDAVLPELKRVIALGLQAGKKQEAMIDNILQIYAAELSALFGRRDGTWPGVDVRAASERAAEMLRPQFAQQDVKMEFDVTGVRAGSLPIQGDEPHLERILSNLLGNALRFSPPGGSVRVKVWEDSDNVHGSVEDDGGGVAPHIQAQLFQKFKQGAVGRGRVGLGLYFCRITLSKWGGEIGYKRAAVGRGSCFWFRIPKVQVRPRSGIRSLPPPSPASPDVAPPSPTLPPSP